MTVSPLTEVIVPGITTGISSTDPTRVHQAVNCFYFAKNYGVKASNPDNTTAIYNLLADIAAGNGAGTLSATVFWPDGIIRADGQIVIPVDAGSPVPAIRPMRWIGTGAHSSGRGDASQPVAGTILDFRYSGGSAGPADAKIKSLGLGRVEIEGITFTDLGVSSNPFFYWTNTDLVVHDCAVWGNPSKSGVTCDQDAFICGGTTASFDGSDTAAFQGYASRITDNYFGHIRRAYYARSDVNGIPFRGNTIWSTCGTNLSDDAPIFLEGISAKKVTGARIFDNLIELAGGYAYAVKCDQVNNAILGPNDLYDPSGAVVAAYRFGANTRYCTAFDGYRGGDAFPLVSEDASAGASSWLTGHQSQESRWAQPWRFKNHVYHDNNGIGPRLLDSSGNEFRMDLLSGEAKFRYTAFGGSVVDVVGFKTSGHLRAYGGTPSAAAQAAAGSGATTSVAGKDLASVVTVTTGTGPTSGQLAIVTLASSPGFATRVPIVAPANSAAAACGVPWASSAGAGQFEINVPIAPAASTACKWNCFFVGS